MLAGDSPRGPVRSLVGPPPPGATRGLGVFLAFCCQASVYASTQPLSMIDNAGARRSIHECRGTRIGTRILGSSLGHRRVPSRPGAGYSRNARGLVKDMSIGRYAEPGVSRRVSSRIGKGLTPLGSAPDFLSGGRDTHSSSLGFSLATGPSLRLKLAWALSCQRFYYVQSNSCT